jgi:predicted metal-binding membrane protein
MDNVLRQFSSRPRIVLWASLAVLVGMSFVSLAASLLQEGSWLSGFLYSLCTPAAPGGLATGMAMWSAMVLAMMLPSAVPMLSAYLDISEAARAKSIPVAPPLLLAGGYLVVWLIFAAAAALLQSLAGPAIAGMASGRGAGLLFIIAGLYQFTPLKHACLRQCRQPMPYFLANWTEAPLGVFRMGLEQGLLCLGCCWAMMVLAFAAGGMNLAWMAAIGIVMILEKVIPESKALVSGLGAGLAGAGLVLVIAG